MRTGVCKCMNQLHSMHAITGRRHLRLGYCLPCTAMAVTAESKRFFVMGQPVANTTASLAVTCTHTRTLQPSYDRLARLPPWSIAVTADSERLLVMEQPVAGTTAPLACTHTHTLQLSCPTLPDLFLLYVCESNFQGSCISCSFGHLAGSRTRLYPPNTACMHMHGPACVYLQIAWKSATPTCTSNKPQQLIRQKSTVACQLQ